MNGLGKRVVEVLAEHPMIDGDQRSALGMARSWLDNGEEIRWNPDQAHYEKRDILAKALVDVIRDEDRDEAIEALADGRRVVNAPFVTEEMRARAEARAAAGVVGSVKKEKKRTASDD